MKTGTLPKTRKARAKAIISKVKSNGVVAQIIALRKAKFERREIIDLGFNKNTVHRQVHEFEMAKG
jgi:hypothetical protein